MTKVNDVRCWCLAISVRMVCCWHCVIRRAASVYSDFDCADDNDGDDDDNGNGRDDNADQKSISATAIKRTQRLLVQQMTISMMTTTITSLSSV